MNWLVSAALFSSTGKTVSMCGSVSRDTQLLNKACKAKHAFFETCERRLSTTFDNSLKTDGC